MSTRKALIVGIDHYKDVTLLNGCVNDGRAMSSVLGRNSDGTINFETKEMFAISDNTALSKKELKESIRKLFEDPNEISLLYFSGHGYVEDTGGYLCTSEIKNGDDGLSMNEIMTFVQNSPALNKIIIFDCCHAGSIGNSTIQPNTSFLKEGTTILAASAENQYAIESGRQGIYTRLFVDAMNGSASNLLGEVTPGSVYAHIDKSLGAWDQRPIFKTNVKKFICLRKTKPSIDIEDLKKIITLFPDKNLEFQLDPSYEPDSNEPNTQNTSKFSILQKYNRLNLLIPCHTEHMYYAAMESKSCKLTALGEHYWDLVKNGRI